MCLYMIHNLTTLHRPNASVLRAGLAIGAAVCLANSPDELQWQLGQLKPLTIMIYSILEVTIALFWSY